MKLSTLQHRNVFVDTVSNSVHFACESASGRTKHFADTMIVYFVLFVCWCCQIAAALAMGNNNVSVAL
jgi:hypothetical protein